MLRMIYRETMEISVTDDLYYTNLRAFALENEMDFCNFFMCWVLIRKQKCCITSSYEINVVKLFKNAF